MTLDTVNQDPNFVLVALLVTVGIVLLFVAAAHVSRTQEGLDAMVNMIGFLLFFGIMFLIFGLPLAAVITGAW